MVIAIAHYRLLMQSVKGLSFGACVPECQPSLLLEFNDLTSIQYL